MLKVKICGITNLEDAEQAVNCGADALGFVFFEKSPRYISPADAGKIIAALPPFVTPVGVFVHAKPSAVMGAVAKSGVRLLQMHGDEPPGYCVSFGMPFVKSLRVRNMESLKDIEDCPGAAAYLLDAYCEDAFGGTGLTFNWDIALEAKKYGRVILSGGLTPENVADAVSHVRPYAVDVSSGVEADKGRKDHDKVMRFIVNAKAAGV